MNVVLSSCSFDEGILAKGIQLDSHYPLGLASIHSYLTSLGHDVRTLNLNYFPPDLCMSYLEKYCEGADYVGLQVLSHNRTATFRAIEMLGDRYKIVLGGHHTTSMYEQIVNKYRNVIAVLGEGEYTMSEILYGIPLEDIPGVAYWDGEKVVRTEDRPLITDLDALPPPAHHPFYHEYRRTASVMTSRGCPHKCSFCALGVITRHKVRFRSPESVVSEIVKIKNDFPLTERVWIHDDSFLMDNKRAIKICEMLQKANTGLKFICSGRFKPISKEVVDALVAANFVHVLFGLESGCQRILDRCRKGIRKEDAVKAFELFRGTPIMLTAFLIVGLPGEDFYSVEETVKFVNELQAIKYCHYEDIIILMVYPGTEVYELMKQAGKITDDFWLTDEVAPFYTVDHDVETLNLYMESILDRIAAGRLLKKLKTWQLTQ